MSDDFLTTFFSGIGSAAGVDTSVGAPAVDTSFFDLFKTAPDQGQSWLMKDYPYKEPHPLDDWVQQSFQGMANERHLQLKAQEEAAAARVPSPAPSTSSPMARPSSVFRPRPYPATTDPNAVVVPDDSFMSTIPPDDSFLTEGQPRPEGMKPPMRLGVPPERDSLSDIVSQAYRPAIGSGQQLPVGGSMFGKSWADVPRDGRTPESRMWGGPRAGGRHAGVDIPGRPGDPVFAVGGGTVLRVGEGQGYGKMVDVRFPDGTIHRFGHLDSIAPNMKVGAQLRPGDVVGGLGFTGNAGREFPHLHLEVFKDEKAYTQAQGKSSRASWNLRMDPVAYYNRGAEPMSNKNEGVKVASTVTGDFLDTVRFIESGDNPNKRTGSYKGYFQLSESDFRKYGGKGSIFDPTQNTKAAAAKFSDIAERVSKSIGRDPSAPELYLAHQQGVAGLTTHVKNPDLPAWKNMQNAASSGERWAKRAVWGNLTPEAQRRFGSVESITSRQFLEFWSNRFENVKTSRSK